MEDSLSLMVVVPDKQGYTHKGYDEFYGNDKDVLHNRMVFIS